MEKQQFSIDNEDNGLDTTEENKDTDYQHKDLLATDEENFIKTDHLNIDTLRGDNKDSDSLTMGIEKDEKKDNLISEAAKREYDDRADRKLTTVKDKIASLSTKIVKHMGGIWNGYIQISGSNLLYPVLFFIGTIIYLELVTHLLIYRSFDMKMIYPVLFALPLGMIFGLLTGFFTEIINKILLFVFTGLICFVFNVQLVYFYVFKVYFSFQTLGMAGDAVSEFGSDILIAMKANIGGIFLLFLPVFLLIFIANKVFDCKRRGIKEQVILLGTSVVFHIVALVALLLFGKGDYTPYDLYHNTRVQDLCGKQLGITTMTRLDIAGLVGDKDELVLADTAMIQIEPTVPAITPTPIPVNTNITKAPKPEVAAPTLPPTPTPIDTSPNIMNIDFNELADNEKNDTIQTLHQYFASATPTNKNEYTGMFKGYNLIMITAEGFSPYAVNPEKTPTLYKLVNEGFVFNNFYTALWQTSTSDGEYVAMTGLIPTGSRSMYLGRDNLWPFSLGNQFNQLGVASKAYHNHTYTYYQRNETHPNLGYIFKAKGNGLILEHPDAWPASDVELINASVDEFVEEDQFNVYYLTVSGHMNYSFIGNSMSYKNKDLVKDLPYSDDARAYIACQMELDMAIELLIAKLEQAGVADRTVIALSADHYPYGWEKERLDELAGHEVDPVFEVYRNHFILWCEGMEEKIVVDKPCSSLDIIPTLSNLFGLEYDSRLLMGQDILSDAPPLVILSNRSFITDKVMYNSETGEATLLTEEPLPEDYISNLNKIVKNKFKISDSILDKDYYRYVFQE